MGQAHDYAKVAFDLIDDLDRLTEVDRVMSRVSATLADFGYTSFLITGVPEPPQRLEPYILLNGWPKGWTEHYTRSNYYADDPVAAWCRRTVNPFEWSQAPFDAARSPQKRRHAVRSSVNFFHVPQSSQADDLGRFD